MNGYTLRMFVTKDTGVDNVGSSLAETRVLFVVSGGIAAVETVRLLRELRRHQAQLTIMMTKEAEKIITPLAVSWAAGEEVKTSWDSDMVQLSGFDVVLVAPATRNTIAKHINGIMDTPVMMALSAARGSQTPIVFIPSMHQDLFDDPVTEALIDSIEAEGNHCLFSELEEGRIKQPNPVQITAELAHIVNSQKPHRKRIAITLGANRAPIDAVRAIQNASSGRTGWVIAEYMYRQGHDVICIAGKTSADPSFSLPDIRRAGAPDEMLSACIELAKEDSAPDVWIHAAAVLDYYAVAESGKKASGEENWNISLRPGPKHIAELSDLVSGSIRIGFKLETGVSVDELLVKAHEQLERYGSDAVVANLLEHLRDDNFPRARILSKDGSLVEASNEEEMCSAMEAIFST